MTEPAPRPALFLDRDGVINVDSDYLHRPEDFNWIDGAIETIRSFNQLGWWVFVVTNQSGIARGYYTEDQMHALHAWLNSELAREGAGIDRFYHCPHHEDGVVERYRRASPDRKPAPGMLLRAMQDFPVVRERSVMIGDRPTDMQAAEAAGVRGYLFEGGNLRAFAQPILEAAGG